MCFDEIFASLVSVHSLEQWLKNSKFGQLQNLFIMKLKPNLINLFFLCYMMTASSVALIKNIEIDRLSLAAKSPMSSTSNSLVCTVLDENLDENDRRDL
jgi:hypothetical protein